MAERNRREAWFEWAWKLQNLGEGGDMPEANEPGGYDVPFCEGRTPLISAILARRRDLILKIVEGSADLDLHDLEGKTPLIHAVETEQPAIVRFLLRCGCDPDKPDPNGRSPLMYAAYKGSKGILVILAEHGGRVDRVDADGRTVADYARHKRRPEESASLMKTIGVAALPRGALGRKPPRRLSYTMPEYINYLYARALYSAGYLKIYIGWSGLFVISYAFVRASVSFAGFWGPIPALLLSAPFVLWLFHQAARIVFHYELVERPGERANGAAMLPGENAVPDFESYRQSRALSKALRYVTHTIATGQNRGAEAPPSNPSRLGFGVDPETDRWLLRVGAMLVGVWLLHGLMLLPVIFLCLVLGLVFRFIVRSAIRVTKRRLLSVQSRRSQAATRFRDQVSRPDATGVETGAPFALFLRSFQQDEELLVADVDFEAVLVYSIGQLCEVVALGGQGRPGQADERLGATRLMAADEEWREMVSTLARRAAVIIMIPHDTAGVRWEIQHLVETGLVEKSVFIMPPVSFLKRKEEGGAKERGRRLKDVWAELLKDERLGQIELLPYFPRGSMFTLARDGRIRDWDALGIDLLPWLLEPLALMGDSTFSGPSTQMAGSGRAAGSRTSGEAALLVYPAIVDPMADIDVSRETENVYGLGGHGGGSSSGAGSSGGWSSSSYGGGSSSSAGSSSGWSSSSYGGGSSSGAGSSGGWDGGGSSSSGGGSSGSF